MRYLLIILLFASCRKQECRKCYYTEYVNGKPVSEVYDKTKCLEDGEFYNPTFQVITNGVNYICR